MIQSQTAFLLHLPHPHHQLDSISNQSFKLTYRSLNFEPQLTHTSPSPPSHLIASSWPTLQNQSLVFNLTKKTLLQFHQSNPQENHTLDPWTNLSIHQLIILEASQIRNRISFSNHLSILPKSPQPSIQSTRTTSIRLLS